MTRVCPLLGLTGDRRSVVDGFDAGHRCHADSAPLPIERQWQARFCLTPAHPQCERYQQAMARRGTSVSGRAPIGDGLVSTRMILAPEPAWRGMAGRARRAGPGRLVAIGAIATVVGAGVVAVIATANGGADRTGEAPDGSPSEGASASTRPSRAPRPSATPAPLTPAPTATSAPLTPAPTATIAPAPTPRTYVVQEGDTLAEIAQQFGTTVESIQAANGIEDPDAIGVGAVLVIP